MNHIGYLTSHKYIFQILSESAEPFNVEVGEHRDIESQNYYMDNVFMPIGTNI